MNKNSEGFITSLIRNGIERKRVKGMYQNAHNHNVAERNVTHYADSEIEGFFDPNDTVDNVIFTGDSQYYANKIAWGSSDLAYNKNIPTIILHDSNKDLEREIARAFGGEAYIINSNNNNKYYLEPFINLSKDEISSLLIKSSSVNQQYRIGGSGKFYIDAMSEYMLGLKRKPTLHDFMTWSHFDMNDRIDNKVANNSFQSNLGNKLKSMIMQGQTESVNIQNYLFELKNQCVSVLTNNQNVGTSINKAVKEQRIIMIDIGSSTNSLFIDLLIEQIYRVIASNHYINLVLSNIVLTANSALESLIKTKSAKIRITITTSDIYNTLNCDEILLKSVFSDCSRLFIMQHPSMNTCEKLADIIGHYDKVDVNRNYSQGRNISGGFGFSRNNQVSHQESITKTHIIDPKEINRLSPNEIYIYRKKYREWAYTILL